MNILVIIAILVLVCVSIDIIALIFIMQVILGLNDLTAVEMIALPSVQVTETPSSMAANTLIDL